jgi:hypothetical protein
LFVHHGGCPLESPLHPWTRRRRATFCTSRCCCWMLPAATGSPGVTKANGSSWIFEPHVTCANALQRGQNPGFSALRHETWVGVLLTVM